MRCINADDIVYDSIDSSDTCRHESYYGTGIFAVRKEDIDAMPTIEPERKTGKWEITNLGAVGVFDSCSECKRVVKHKAPFYNFCPHCGAKNGGERQ